MEKSGKMPVSSETPRSRNSEDRSRRIDLALARAARSQSDLRLLNHSQEILVDEHASLGCTVGSFQIDSLASQKAAGEK